MVSNELHWQNIVWESNDVHLLRIALDNNLKFDKNLSNICSKASKKLSVLTTVANLLPFKKRHILLKAFIESQCKYCRLVLMFHGRQIDDKINKVHERGQRIVSNDSITSIEELLVKDKTFTILYVIKIFNHWQLQCIKL